MFEKPKIDLHLHTTVSDGTDSPEEILENVKRSGIGIFSVTDHDAVKSAFIMRGILKSDDPLFIPGVEFSCRDSGGKYHILGYGYDPESAPITSVVDFSHGLRMKKVKTRLDFIDSEFGFSFSKEDTDKLLSLDNPGKPHIGNLMVKYGYAETKEQAIREYIDKLHLKSEYLSPEKAISGILGSGGIPVLAHPFYGSGDELILGEDMENRICRLMEHGLKGIEAFYSGFTEKLRHRALELAEKYDLYITAGSDYHGKNKFVNLGDTGLCEDDEVPERLKGFLNNFIK